MLNARATSARSAGRARVPERYAERAHRGGAVWIFGLQWTPLIGGRAAAQARSRARRAGATHFIWAGNRGIVAGHAQLPAQRGRQWASAALAFADRHPDGVAAAIVPLPDGRFWVVAAQDGTVIARTDVLFSTAAQAIDAVDALQHALPGCTVLDVPDAALFLDALCDKPSATSMLRPVQAAWVSQVRRFRLVVLMVFTLAAAWWLGRPEAVPTDLSMRHDLSPAQRALAWEGAVRAQWAATRVHLPHELRRVMTSMQRLPVDLNGWGLRRATCRAGQTAWQCEAAFVRDAAQATNADFNARVPHGWQVRFDLLSGAALTWTVASEATALVDVVALASPRAVEAASAATDDAQSDAGDPRQRVDLRLASHMQRISAAFTQVSLSGRQAVPLVPPQDAQGQPLARVAGMPELWQRVLKLEGPLRSFALFAQPPATIAWHEIVVDVDTPPGISLKLSPLTARLTGIVYEPL